MGRLTKPYQRPAIDSSAPPGDSSENQVVPSIGT